MRSVEMLLVRISVTMYSLSRGRKRYTWMKIMKRIEYTYNISAYVKTEH